ncbi:dephospho-CoA kinase/protein folding accessory domain-containing protein [Streptomyces sp. ADI92-24]|uniref:GrpB family protein n=1 Tax=Streptomyces sp. ADI92-24 TaxID=1522756 RepID=UPI000F54E64E|nr:GrpB family protein [Streptomyces sp. ADI92-24]RPK48359.1 dephospho-CoA kinase/protein folding accessory domain-containing protein [Streptomyces sp. ADI92-24]
MTGMIVVSDYDPRWPERFEDLRQRLAPHVADLTVSIEHVGSTAVPGCAAKPIIDLDIVVSEEAVMPELISRLAGQDYRHEGDLGIPGREAFQAPPAAPEHHLYGVVAGSKPHLDHVLLRDYLRQRTDEVQRYSALKVALAQRFPADSEGRAAYSAAKSALVEELVAKSYAARAASES